ncbi:MAG: hypothetical protein FJ242_02670 [Nitrospira sp.]|nr:hypothetical protein [Nitrospira sp.]
MKEKILISLFLIAVFINFLGPIIDVDFPFHLKTGEYIYQHKAIPEDDPFSFYGEGVSTDREKFTLSQYWLAQVIFFKLYTTFGPTGAVLLRAITFFLFVFLLWFVLSKRGLYSSILIAILITIILLPYRLDRPQFFSFLFALILILLLEKFREKPDSVMPLYFIPPLMLLWSNMHAGFVFGLVVILIYTMSETIKFFLKKIKSDLPIGQPLTAKSVLMLLLTGLSAIIFSYINPDFNGQLLATFESHTYAKWLYYGVREYMSPVEETRFPFKVAIANISFWVLFGFISILIVLNIIRSKSINITTVILFFFSSVAAFTSVRYIPFFIALAIPLSKDYRFFKVKDETFLRRFKDTPFLFILFSIFFVFAIGVGFKDYKNLFTMGMHRFYPEKAANFLLSNQIDAKMFNSNNRGSYLIWKLYPHYRVFQDTRYISIEATIDGIAIRHALDHPAQTFNLALGSALSDLVPQELGKIQIFSEKPFSNTGEHKPFWKKLLDQYKIDLIVHEATADYTGILFPLTLRLLKDDEWVLIHLDGIMQIFIRNDEKYSEIIERFKKPKEFIYDEIIIETAPLVKSKITFSTPYSSLALALVMKEKDEDAKKMIEAALELDRKDLVANFCNAYLALKQKQSKHEEHTFKGSSHGTQ